MAQYASVVPWAEEVDGAPYPMTIAGLLALPFDAEWRYELVNGILVRMPASTRGAPETAARLVVALQSFVSPRNLGRVFAGDGIFNLTPPGATRATALVPEVAFVRANRMVSSHGSAVARKSFRLAPDLVVEVAAPNHSRPDMLEKVKLCLAAGTRLIWVVWPAQRKLDVWHLPIPIDGQPAVQLGMGDMLDGSQALTGFTLPVADLFA
jgi:Uma2 family endonuclease